MANHKRNSGSQLLGTSSLGTENILIHNQFSKCPKCGIEKAEKDFWKTDAKREHQNGRKKWCAPCRDTYFKFLSSLGATRKKPEHSAAQAQVEIETKGRPKDLLEEYGDLAEEVGAWKWRALTGIKGTLKQKKAWCAYFSKKRQLANLLTRLRSATPDKPKTLEVENVRADQGTGDN